MSGARAAVVGAGGLLGGAIAARLASDGFALRRIGRGEDADTPWDARGTADLPARALEGCGLLVHAAGVTDEDCREPGAAFAKATQGARALARAAAAQGVRRIAYVSSAHVYGPLEGRLDESSPPFPLSDYALAHHAAEQVFRGWSRETGGTLLVLRPCAAYGPLRSVERFRRWSLIPFDFPRQALGGRIVLKSFGEQRRNFVPADGVAAEVARWIGDGAPARVSNAVGGRDLSVHAFAQLCARLAQEETGRACVVERPASGAAPEPLRYEGCRVHGQSLEDHVRDLFRALRQAGMA